MNEEIDNSDDASEEWITRVITITKLEEELKKANIRIQYLETLLTSLMARLNDLMKVYVDWRDKGQQSEPQIGRIN